ncbi:hypothetical protein [Solirubrobacter soli]|uniref:hypothetical protein n=1 Tax=Solirubrobacter soli TaxID=363832 RepID=UPI000407CF62|nr:hypothetical protein [Solirubrobacter soli]
MRALTCLSLCSSHSARPGAGTAKSAEHHGTPEQRRDAWLLGLESGDPSRCDRYVPGA